MLVLIRQGYEEVSREAARIVSTAIKRNPNLVLGLATGSTPQRLYSELIRLHLTDGLDFRNVVTFNLDEYLGLAPEHPQSYNYFMHRNLFDQINIRKENVHIPDGTVSGDYESYCESYEAAIRDVGGIGLQILGIGPNGHIGFNEPTSSLGSRTRVKTLTEDTISANRRFFKSDEVVPQCAITMGIGTILDAKRVLMLAAGKNKANAIAGAIEGPITSSITGSALQIHRDVTVVIDVDASTNLKHRDYYVRVAEMTKIVTPERLW